MRLSELISKELIDVTTGSRMGPMTKADLEIDEKSGKLATICLEIGKKGFFSNGHAQEVKIAWNAIHAIGEQTILVKSP